MAQFFLRCGHQMWDFLWGKSGARGLLVGKLKSSWDFAHVRIFDVGFEVGFFTLKWDFFENFSYFTVCFFYKINSCGFFSVYFEIYVYVTIKRQTVHTLIFSSSGITSKSLSLAFSLKVFKYYSKYLCREAVDSSSIENESE